MIIFVEKEDRALTTMLEEAVRFTFGNRMFQIRTEQELRSQERIIKNTMLGAVMLTKNFGRGVNLRFAVDSEVLVLVNHDYIGLPLVRQMVGRSSRRQGLCIGRVFIKTDLMLSNSQDGALD
jgi:hypothetical protein